MKEGIFESLFIDLKFKNQIVTCGTIYRLPKQDNKSNLEFLSTFKIFIMQDVKSKKSMPHHGRHEL